MSPKLPRLNGKKVAHLLEENGFIFVSQKGSHAKFRDSEGQTAIVPMHDNEDIGAGLLLRILKDAGIDPDALRR
ncbi:hypothetical protein FACS1894187_07580 [Synergistales bacterium]|nr:hypothetical protein FACS1894187_07580 [Synergistales bacterium]